MKSARLLALVSAAVGLTTAPLLAQDQGTVELGFDAAAEFQLYGGDLSDDTRVSVPTQRVRVGFWLSDQVSLEPGVGFDWLDVEDQSFTALRLDLSGLYHFGQVGATRPYLRAGGVFDLLSNGDSATQLGAGGGVGMKIPATDNLGVRLEGAVTRFFENDDFFGYTALQALIGFSFFIN